MTHNFIAIKPKASKGLAKRGNVFPETPVARACFPNVSQFCHSGKHCFQRQFCFQEAKFASATQQKHFVFPRGMETWQNEETITETYFWKHVSSFCQALRSRYTIYTAVPFNVFSSTSFKTSQIECR